MNNCFIILAAGESKRFNSNIPKPYHLYKEKPLLLHSVEKAKAYKKINQIMIVINKKHTNLIRKLNIKGVKIIIGGKTRAESAFKALNSIRNNKIVNVLIHDAARPCLDVRDLKELFAKGNSSTIGLSLGYPLTNALKKVNSGLQVTGNIKRDNLYMSFTPQIFNFSKLFLAYTDIIKKEQSVDDEIEAMTKSGHKVKLMKSSPRNIKLTYQDDLEVIKALMKKI